MGQYSHLDPRKHATEDCGIFKVVFDSADKMLATRGFQTTSSSEKRVYALAWLGKLRDCLPVALCNEANPLGLAKYDVLEKELNTLYFEKKMKTLPRSDVYQYACEISII